MTNIEITKYEDSILLKITKETFPDNNTIDIPEEIIDDTCENTEESGEELLDTESEPLRMNKIFDPETNNFTDNYTNVLITGDISVKDKVNEMVSSIFESIGDVYDIICDYTRIIVLDSEDEEAFIGYDKRINGIEEGLNYLGKIIADGKTVKEPKFLFINNIEQYFFRDSKKFTEEINRISKIPNYHIIATSTNTDLLCFGLTNLFKFRSGFWLSNTLISRLLYGSNLALSVFDEECIISRDFGKTAVLNTIQTIEADI